MIFNPIFINQFTDAFKIQRASGELSKAIGYFFEKKEGNSYRLKPHQDASTALNVMIGRLKIVNCEDLKDENIKINDQIIQSLVHYYLVFETLNNVHEKDAVLRFNALFGAMNSNLTEDKRMVLTEISIPTVYQPISYFYNSQNIIEDALCSQKLALLFNPNINLVLDKLNTHYQIYLNTRIKYARQAFDAHLLNISQEFTETFGIAPPGYNPVTHTYNHNRTESKNEDNKKKNDLEGISFMKKFTF